MEIQLNLNKICRLCLEEKFEQLQDVFANGSTLCENILRATTVKIQQGDGLPARVCQHCISLVNVIINFQRKCVVTDLALHHYVRKCICHKEHKECEAAKFYPKDPLRLTHIVKTEGGPCHIKSETSVFQLQESREEVITGIIEEISSNPKVNVKPEMSDSTKAVKGRQINSKCISINLSRVQKAHKRKRRKGHRWITKKQSSMSRKRGLDAHPEDTGLLDNTESSGQNRVTTPAAEEGLPNVVDKSTMTVSKRGCVLKTRKSRNSNPVVVSKKLLQKTTMSSDSDAININKNPAEENLQIERTSQNSVKITENNKVTEKNVQSKRTCESSNTAVANKKMAPKEFQQNTKASEVSKTFPTNRKSLVEDSTSKQVPPLEEHVQIRTRNSLSRKPVKEDSTPSTTNQKLEMEPYVQIQRVLPPTETVLGNKLVSDEAERNQMAQQTSQNLKMDEQTENSSNKKPATTEESTSNQSGKSEPANQKLVAEDQIRRRPPMRKSFIKKQIKPAATPSQKIVPNIKSSVDYKLVAGAHVRIEKVSPLINSAINKPITEEPTVNESNKFTNQKLVLEKDVQTQKLSLRRKSNNKTSETVQDGALLPTSETFQPKEGSDEQQNSDSFTANEKHFQNMSGNTVSTKRKTTETESSVPEALSTKKQKTQENDRLTKLVIHVEGNKLCCSQCDSWFEEVDVLKRHLEELHNKRVIRWHKVTGPGPKKDAPPSFLCASCGKQFTSQRLFTVHQNQKCCS